jgi:hypothetical protein
MPRKRKSKSVIFQGDAQELCTLIDGEVWTIYVRDEVRSRDGESIGFYVHVGERTMHIRRDNSFGQLARAVQMIREDRTVRSSARGAA